MKIVRVELVNKGEIFHGILGPNTVRRIRGDIFSEHIITDDEYNLAALKILAPLNPVNILAIGLNYKKHAQETGKETPKKPVIFFKATSSVMGPNEKIVLPKEHPDEVDFEAELAIIIGKEAKNVEPDQAYQYVYGYTCGNDITARDCQNKLDIQWARAKSFDTFCPLGPWIETNLNPDDLSIKSKLNNNVMQDSRTSDMIFSPSCLISYCSKNMTLLPGTVIMTGTPAGVGTARNPKVYLNSGDIIEIEIEGIGVLKNTVK